MTFTYLCLFLSLHVIIVTSAEGEAWCYEIQKSQDNTCKGPREWPGFCNGTEQSPINIVTKHTTFDKKLTPFQFSGYDSENTLELKNDGHSAKVILENKGISITGGGLVGTYIATQLHFHWGSSAMLGSEHSIDGERYPAELHIVHTKVQSSRTESGGETSAGGRNVAVLGFFIEEIEDKNVSYNDIIDSLARIKVKDMAVNVSSVKLRDLIPNEKTLEHFYRYDGSLTTPECNEVVTWTVFPETIKLGKSQLERLYTNLTFSTGVTMEENFRPVQKLGSRIVYTSGVQAVLSQSKYVLFALIVAYIVSAS